MRNRAAVPRLQGFAEICYVDTTEYNHIFIFFERFVLHANRTRSRARDHTQSNAAPLIAGAVVNLLLLLVLMIFSYLREEPMFWTNAGGCSKEAQDLVASLYYPLLLLELFILLAFSWVSIRLLISRHASARLSVVMLPTLWGLFFVIMLNSLANNLENLLNGRPLHWHPGDRWSTPCQAPAAGLVKNADD
ncbi:hypothetical protein [uncultured Lamprocystis sp.]|jgi:hypothetical protein|uniref:hypothetical protein n=1 Tax=uncultured Lamprocystis sp. TaxID=543132 RepID=UPI0025D5D580|nr:hypothetical protein [uncultured Lamprocystis sp.]